MARNDLIGRRFGRLQVIEYDHKAGRKKCYKCRCDCGNIVIVRGCNLTAGHTQSCGCLRKEVAGGTGRTHGKENGKKYGAENFRKAGENKKGIRAGRYKHGLTGTRLYIIWASMKQRCYNPKAHEYSVYGGRGIEICQEWKNNVEKFAQWALSHGYADNLTIERKDVNGNYCPENCCWIPKNKQYENMQRNAKKKP